MIVTSSYVAIFINNLPFFKLSSRYAMTDWNQARGDG